ncbi:MAG: phage minor head protein, partial [Dehalococcoidia bacterium]
MSQLNTDILIQLPPIDQEFAAQSLIRHLGAIERADKLAKRVAAPAVTLDRQLRKWLKTEPDLGQIHRKVAQLQEAMTDEMTLRMAEGLELEARRAYEASLGVWMDVLDPEHWHQLLGDRGLSVADLPIVESHTTDFPVWDTRTPSPANVHTFIKQSTLALPSGPTVAAGLTVFRPPSRMTIRNIIASPGPGGIPWDERIRRLSKLAPAGDITGQLVSGISHGENLGQLTRRLRPIVKGNHASAARIARTESLRVSETINREQYLAQPMVIGAQVLSALGETTRPHHAARHGTIYYKAGVDAEGHQISQMPQLPDEPNCLCWSTPVFDQPDADDKAKVGPLFDPGSIETQWAGWTPKQQKRMVGARRWNLMNKRSAGMPGGKPSFNDFINPADGKLLPVNTLKAETAAARRARRTLAQEIQAARLKDIKLTRARTLGRTTNFTQPTPSQIQQKVKNLGNTGDGGAPPVLKPKPPTPPPPPAAPAFEPPAPPPGVKDGPALRVELKEIADEAQVETAKLREKITKLTAQREEVYQRDLAFDKQDIAMRDAIRERNKAARSRGETPAAPDPSDPNVFAQLLEPDDVQLPVPKGATRAEADAWLERNAQRKAMWKDYDKIQHEIQLAIGEQGEVAVRALAKGRKVIKADNPIQKPKIIRSTDRVPTAKQQRDALKAGRDPDALIRPTKDQTIPPQMQEDLTRLSEVWDKRVLPGLEEKELNWVVQRATNHPGRGQFLSESTHARGRNFPNRVEMQIEQRKGLTAHETTHWLEHEYNGAVHQRAVKFLRSRTQGEATQKLSKLTGNRKYRADEVALEDKFLKQGGSHYDGKVYDYKGRYGV